MIYVSNTSPIFYLSTIGHLDLFRQLYSEILIPQAVFNEITSVGNTDVSATVIPTLSWIKTRSVTNRELVSQLKVELDPGEAEAIALAVELNADRLFMDERLGRTAAIRVGLEVTGVLGILIAAKRNNLIEAVKPLLDSLTEGVGFWVSEQLYVEILRSVDESSETSF
jgi:uncharacterized protein